MMGELCAPAAEADEQDDDAVEIQEEVEPLKAAPSPPMPSPADVEEHRVAHKPYRSWCEDCVRGCALGEQRGQHAGRSHDMAIVGLECFYIAEEGLVRKDELQYPGGGAIKDARLTAEIAKCLIIRCFECKKSLVTWCP